ncbi:hypothetical protein CAOG_03913 [Capsaspora owczarzaki ATCC 30864]|uniref:Pre-mRNA-splicing factor 38 n=1 Tax=Capsaspora owczarzaki (strain ATCC 30864) TaxID=595528 RepID=A0A0D2VQS3_CAPO3|nr:hypothetical protein CAOG_03913 [Capsaspora owczarzaki ATCC 30864]KJE93067.1 hypothetical protein CAOG_003913 [Capsaspora owczarzaki ATCC 30864]|eukprot:XP_004363641.1 hypothetical protein CAOG_03913 [Capsaspora owczarzaki ATCC 30864]
MVKNALELWGNQQTMNLNLLLHQNILSARYYKEDLSELNTYQELIDEIFNSVSDLEPFMPGGGTKASSAFCLLYKLFVLRLTENQLTAMLNHADSPFIRAIGFLYLRYCTPPKDLWDWFEPYLEDQEPIKLQWAASAQPTTIGEFVRGLLVDSKFLGTLLPRIPVPITKEIQANFAARGQSYLPANDEDKSSAAAPATETSGSSSPVGGRSRDRPSSPSGRDDRRGGGGGGGGRSRSPPRRRSRSRSPSNRRRYDDHRDSRRYDDRDRRGGNDRDRDGGGRQSRDDFNRYPRGSYVDLDNPGSSRSSGGHSSSSSRRRSRSRSPRRSSDRDYDRSRRSDRRRSHSRSPSRRARSRSRSRSRSPPRRARSRSRSPSRKSSSSSSSSRRRRSSSRSPVRSRSPARSASEASRGDGDGKADAADLQSHHSPSVDTPTAAAPMDVHENGAAQRSEPTVAAEPSAVEPSEA